MERARLDGKGPYLWDRPVRVESGRRGLVASMSAQRPHFGRARPASSSLECRHSVRCGGSCSDVCCLRLVAGRRSLLRATLGAKHSSGRASWPATLVSSICNRIDTGARQVDAASITGHGCPGIFRHQHIALVRTEND
jgi:hypothetical protein